MSLFDRFRSDRAVRKFETALGASQHPTGHISALGSLVIVLMISAGERTAAQGGENFFGG